MKNKKIQAIALRKKGYSYNEISQQLILSKSTLSLWLRDLNLDKRAKARLSSRSNIGTALLIKRNKKQTELAKQKAQKIKSEATKKKIKINKEKLFLLGLSLYWAEGYKMGAYGSKWKCVDFANSDPYMIIIMMRFFREICLIEDDKIKLQITGHYNLIDTEAKNYWSKITGLKKKQFIKTFKTKDKYSTNKRGNRLPYGTLHIRIYNTDFFHTIIGWIESLKLSGCSSVSAKG